MEDFSQFALPIFLQNSLKKLGYAKPTIIQEKAIQFILDGKDILATAQTGTGKTGAFLIPLITYLTNNPQSGALILSPTRELSQQIYSVALQMLHNNKDIKAALLIGGDSIHKQIFQLKQSPKLLIGTPGRVSDHINRKNINLSSTSFVVLDETDKMVDMGFGIQIDEIFKFLPKTRQTALFSATIPKSILKLVNNYLTNPVRVESGEVNSISTNINQTHINTNNKYAELLKILENHSGTKIIFVKTQNKAFELCMKIKDQNYRANFIHGGLKQTNRNSVIKNFREQKFDILVATDVASRGLDISHMSYVINYDLPENPEDYVHRIGRVGRGENTGEAISLVSESDKNLWKNIQKFINKEEVDESYRNQYKKKSSGFKNRGSSSFDSKKPFSNKSRFPRKEGSNFSGNTFGEKQRRTSSGEKKPFFGEKKSFSGNFKPKKPSTFRD